MEFNLDIGKVVNDMIQASGNTLIQGGKQVVEYATREYSKFILDIQHVQTMVEEGTITDEVGQSLVDQHKLSMQAVYKTITGLGLVAVQNAVNAALKVLTDALEASLGTVFKGLKFSL